MGNNSAVRTHAEKAIEHFMTIKKEDRTSSAEQGSETLALAKCDVHFLPLPPNFNLRTFTTTGFMDMPLVVSHFHYELKLDKKLKELKPEFGDGWCQAGKTRMAECKQQGTKKVDANMR